MSAPTFRPSQDKAKSLILLLLEHHRLLVHHAVTVEEMPSRAPVSTAHHPQHGHGRPARVEVHAAGELVRPGQGRATPTPPHHHHHRCPLLLLLSPASITIKRYDSGPGSPATASLQKRRPERGGKKRRLRRKTRLPPLPATPFAAAAAAASRPPLVRTGAGSAARLPPLLLRRLRPAVAVWKSCCAVERTRHRAGGGAVG